MYSFENLKIKGSSSKNSIKACAEGFTLMETLVVIAIYSAVIGGVITLLTTVIRTPNQQLRAADNIDQARKVISIFTNEMRNAMHGNDGSYQITSAGDAQVVFYSGYSATGMNVLRIRYFLSGDTLYKGVVTPTGSPLAYNLLSEVVTPVQYNLANGFTPVFYYYNDSYDGATSPLVQPVSLTQVKFVKINLVVKKQSSAEDTSTFVIEGGTAIRSLKTNLGN